MSDPLKKLRAMAKRKSQAQMAIDLDVNPTLLNGILNGKRPMTKRLAARLGFFPVARAWAER